MEGKLGFENACVGVGLMKLVLRGEAIGVEGLGIVRQLMLPLRSSKGGANFQVEQCTNRLKTTPNIRTSRNLTSCLKLQFNIKGQMAMVHSYFPFEVSRFTVGAFDCHACFPGSIPVDTTNYHPFLVNLSLGKNLLDLFIELVAPVRSIGNHQIILKKKQGTNVISVSSPSRVVESGMKTVEGCSRGFS